MILGSMKIDHWLETSYQEEKQLIIGVLRIK